jgi:3-deoxy-D-manno-octulosonate 8-phosphate phosphatase (KDO 8-P phosphatase)
MIKLFVADLDGTITDGAYYVSTEGVITKKFNTRDFYGIYLLQQSNVVVAIVTGSEDVTIDQKVKDFPGAVGIHRLVSDKRECVYNQYLMPNGWLWDDVAFIGDDINDLELLRVVSLAACPKDAHNSVLDFIKSAKDGYICEVKGGDGAVREFSDLILQLNKG